VRNLLAAFSVSFLLATPSWAVLGESVDSLASDRQRLQGEIRSTVADGFTVHEISAADGTVVRQYGSPEGVIFAVSWQGPAVPDLAPLLGSYFVEFQQASSSPVRRRRPVVVQTDRLVVETGGHMRALRGRAYLKDAMPDSVSAAVVR